MKTDNIDSLSSRICELFDKGIKIDLSTLSHLNTIFSISTSTDLILLLQDENSCEVESLLELIFFPDESFQFDMEDILEEVVISDEDIIKLAFTVRKLRPLVNVAFPGESRLLSIPQSKNSSEKFIFRLNLPKKFDKKIILLLQTYFTSFQAKRIRVKLRNSNFENTFQKIEFLCSFLKKSKFSKSSEFYDLLDYLLCFLHHADDFSGLYDSLINARAEFTRLIQKAKDFDSYLNKNNIETIMLRGDKQPMINTDEIKNNIEMIDKIICLLQ